MDEKIRFLIVTSAETGSKNQLSVEQVRQWLSEYLEIYGDDVRQFPALAGKPHVDVLMADFDNTRPAPFVVALFAENSVTLAAGRGGSSSVRDFLERESSTDAVQMIPELASRFFVAENRITVSRQELSNWLKK